MKFIIKTEDEIHLYQGTPEEISELLKLMALTYEEGEVEDE